MQNEELQSLPKYDFEFAGGKFNSYFFQTELEIVYEVTFKPSGYIFEENITFSSQTFEFSVMPIENPKNLNPPLDKRIPNTLASIFFNFFQQNERIVVYVCDTSDMRASARYRKFNQWFDWYKGTSFMKIDMQMGKDTNNEIYFTSLIIRLENPNADEIVAAFRKLIISNQK
jgi:Family of unknown function (DUF6169)